MATQIKFLKGSNDKYIERVESGSIVDTSFYYIDNKDLYLGLVKLSNAEDLNNAVISIVGSYPENTTPTTLYALDTAVQSLNGTVGKHDALLAGLDEGTSIKSLIDSAESASTGAVAAVAALETTVNDLKNNVYTKSETDSKLSTIAVWENMA